MTHGRILLTGAGGFVGSHLAVGLKALGHEVCALDARFDDNARMRLAGCILVEADLAADAADLGALPRADVIVHAAALTTAPEALGISRAAHVAANMRPLLTMLGHAAQIEPEAFVFLSSSGVFAAGDGSPDLTDRDAATAEGPYSAAKRAGEALVSGALGETGCRTFCVRLGYIYGPDEGPRETRRRVSMVRQWLDAAGDGRPVERDASDPRRDWTFAPDLAPALARILSGPGRKGPIHLCSPEAPRDSEVAACIARHYPDLKVREVSGAPVKARMVPSALPELEGFAWTPLAAGLAQLCQARLRA